MKIKNLLGAIALFISVSAIAVSHQQLTVRAFKDVAYFSQTVTLSGTTTATLTVSPLTSSGRGFGLSVQKLTFKDAALGAIPFIPLARPVNQGDALANAKDWVPSKVLPFKVVMANWLRAHGISAGILNYTQEILVNVPVSDANPLGQKKKVVSFNLSLDASGRATYGDPKIIDDNPTVVEVRYIPLTTKDSLPQSWAYPQAGTLRWRVLTQAYLPLTEWTVVDVAGAYDEKEVATDGSATNVNPDAMLGCLMDSRAVGCPHVLDVHALLNTTGSAFALVGYTRSLTPVYTQNSDGTESAKFGMSVDERTWNCENYTNKGSYGFQLALNVDRYFAQLSANSVTYSQVARDSATAVSPTETYSREMSAAELGALDPEQVILSPAPGETYFLRSNADRMAFVTQVAPLTQVIGDAQTVLNNFSYRANDSVSMTPFDEITTDFLVTHARGLGTGSYSSSQVSFELSGATSKHMDLMNVSTFVANLWINGTRIPGNFSANYSPTVNLDSYLLEGVNTIRFLHYGILTYSLRVKGTCKGVAPTATFVVLPADTPDTGTGDNGEGGHNQAAGGDGGG